MAALLTALFAGTRLDIAAAALFYAPSSADHWPLAQHVPWSILYRAATWITASLAVLGLGALVVGSVRGNPAMRRHAVFVLLTLAVGPGLIVNAVFKDHWQRPRPRDTVAFGGGLDYVAAPLRGEGGKSFPCGHCSVGFLYAIGWWIWRRSRPAWAACSLAAGLLCGSALGLGRMAAGGHFLSDVIWSAFLAFAVAHLLYHYVLKIPAHERDRAGAAYSVADKATSPALSVVAALGGVAILLALFATPHGSDVHAEIALASLPRMPAIFQVDARSADVDIVVIDTPGASITITGELHGFGLPTSRLFAAAEFLDRPKATLRYHIEQQGWFTDLDARLSIRIPAAAFERIEARVAQGHVSVMDATAARVVESGRLRIELQEGQAKR